MELVKIFSPTWDLRQKQITNITFITFWSQFSVYAFNTILILFLTRPILTNGLGYTDAQAYTFFGVAQACNYLMPLLGGFMADNVLGVRRAILFGSILLASAYLLIMLSGYSVSWAGDYFFIAAYAFVPVTNSLLMGTASGLIARIYANDSIKAKEAMTYYYMAINVGAILATLIAPQLLESRYGPLSVLTLAFVGKSIAALNFARKYDLYDNVIEGKDKQKFNKKPLLQLLGYIIVVYSLTLLAYSHPDVSNWVISAGCLLGILWFVAKTISLNAGSRLKQSTAILLILEAVIFFIIYNQMNTTLVLFAENNSDHLLFGFSVSAAQYQALNPMLILILGSQLPKLYYAFPRFTIPLQFAAGTILAGLGLFVMGIGAYCSLDGIVSGNYLVIAYALISLAELFVSAIGLSMIGMYCDTRNIAFAMGVWYLASALSNSLSGKLASFVAIPKEAASPIESLPYYLHYYLVIGLVSVILGVLMLFVANWLKSLFKRHGMEVV